jgi:hypothetical protein
MRAKISGGAGLALACAVLLLPACGGDGPTRPTTTTTLPPPPPAPIVVTQGAGPIAVDDVGFIEFTTGAVGRLDITVDWTFVTNDVDVFLVRGTCTDDQILNGTCSFLTFSVSATAKPERLSVPNAPAGRYTLYAANFGPGDESASFQVVLTPNASNLAAGQSLRSGERVGMKHPLRGLRELR